jgi:hypothetical protein
LLKAPPFLKVVPEGPWPEAQGRPDRFVPSRTAPQPKPAPPPNPVRPKKRAVLKDYPYILEHLKPKGGSFSPPEDDSSTVESDLPVRKQAADDVSVLKVDDIKSSKDTLYVRGVNFWVSRVDIQKKSWLEKEALLTALISNDCLKIFQIADLHNFPENDEEDNPFPARSLLIVYVIIARGGRAYCSEEADLRATLEKILVLEVEGSLWDIILPELKKNNKDMEVDAASASDEAKDIWNLLRYKIDQKALFNVICLYNEAQRLNVARNEAIVKEAIEFIPELFSRATSFLDWLVKQREEGEELLRQTHQ